MEPTQTDTIKSRALALLSQELGKNARHAAFVGSLDTVPNADGWRDVGSLLDVGKHTSRPTYRILWRADRDEVRIERDTPGDDTRYAYQWLREHRSDTARVTAPAPAVGHGDGVPEPTDDELRAELVAVMEAARAKVAAMLGSDRPVTIQVAQIEHYRQYQGKDGTAAAGTVHAGGVGWTVWWNRATGTRRLVRMR